MGAGAPGPARMVGLPGEARSTAIVPKGGEAQRQLRAGPGTPHTRPAQHTREDALTGKHSQTPAGGRLGAGRSATRPNAFGWAGYKQICLFTCWAAALPLWGQLACSGSLVRQERAGGGAGGGVASRLSPAVLSDPGGPPLPLGPQGPRLTRVTTASRGELEGAGSRPGRWQAEGGGETLRPPGPGWPGSQP